MFPKNFAQPTSKATRIKATLTLLLLLTSQSVSAAVMGTGADGDLFVDSMFEVDTHRTSLTNSANLGATTINLGSTAGLGIGDELLIINMQGSVNQTGMYESVHISNIAGSSVTLTNPLNTSFSNTNTVAVQRVPNYNNVTIDSTGVLTASAWDGGGGGIVAFRVANTLTVEAGGLIDASEIGYRGGFGGTIDKTDSASVFLRQGQQGESITGTGNLVQTSNIGGGGGGGYSGGDWGGGGGGGGHRLPGIDGLDFNGTGNTEGAGGNSYGPTSPFRLMFGSGGGGGGADHASLGDGEVAYGGDGGRGGGIVFIGAQNYDVQGTIRANGAAGGDAFNSDPPSGGEAGGGGGGAGGTVFLQSPNGTPLTSLDSSVDTEGGSFGRAISNNNLSASGVSRGGIGAAGRVYLQEENLTIDSLHPVVGNGQTLYVDAVRASVQGITGNTIELQDSIGFQVGDEVMIASIQGGSAGRYETARVTGLSGASVTVDNLQFSYPASDVVAIQVVPTFDSLTIQNGGLVTANAWDGQTGGIVAMRVSGLLDIQAGGHLSADGIGFRGGAEVGPGLDGGAAMSGFAGESHTGLGEQGTNFSGSSATDEEKVLGGLPNEGGGGAGRLSTSPGSVGGGGGGGTYSDLLPGEDGGYTYLDLYGGGLAGLPYGGDLTQAMFFGSGGGSGAADSDTGLSISGAGGNGGGMIWLTTGDIELDGELTSRGLDGLPAFVGNIGDETGSGGGGSGGSIFLYLSNSTKGSFYLDPLLHTPGGSGGANMSGAGFSLFGGAGGIGVTYSFVLPEPGTGSLVWFLALGLLRKRKRQTRNA